MKAIRVTTTNDYLASNLAREFGLEVETISLKWWQFRPRLVVVYTYHDDGHWRTDWAVNKFRLRVCRLALIASWAVAEFTEEFIEDYRG